MSSTDVVGLLVEELREVSWRAHQLASLFAGDAGSGDPLALMPFLVAMKTTSAVLAHVVAEAERASAARAEAEAIAGTEAARASTPVTGGTIH